EQQERVSVEAEEGDLRQVGKNQVDLTLVLRGGQGGPSGECERHARDDELQHRPTSLLKANGKRHEFIGEPGVGCKGMPVVIPACRRQRRCATGAGGRAFPTRPMPCAPSRGAVPETPRSVRSATRAPPSARCSSRRARPCWAAPRATSRPGAGAG